MSRQGISFTEVELSQYTNGHARHETSRPIAETGLNGTLLHPQGGASPSDALRAEEQGLGVFEVAGTIKWFDASKGYGFIVPDNGLPDVLLHVTCLRAGGHQTAYEGARVHAQVLRRPKGMQAFRVLSMDESTAIKPQGCGNTHVQVQAESDWERAMVKWFNRVRGFGFLTRGEGTPDIFVHMATLREYGFTELRPGQIIQVRSGIGEKGLMAAELRPDGLQVARGEDYGDR